MADFQCNKLYNNHPSDIGIEGIGMTINETNVDQIIASIKASQGPPALPCLQEDIATVEGIISLLCVKEIIPGAPEEQLAEIRSYVQRYTSPLTALVMLGIDYEIFTEADLEIAISVFHEGIRYFGWPPKANFDEIFQWRLTRLKQRICHDGSVALRKEITTVDLDLYTEKE
jgi:hypothetical protein